jgi:HK97 family phage prohead protease
MTVTEDRAAMSTADINDLPDDAFAYIEPGGTKDESGKTTPRSLRHFPIHDAAHVRNALARLSTSPFGDKAKVKVVAAAHKFGIDVDESKLAADRAAFELRRRRRGQLLRQLEHRGMHLEMRAKPNGSGGTTFEFEGYGAVFDAPFEMWDPWGDPYTEVVRQGAFTRSLSARPDVPFLIGHNDQGIPLARTRNGTMQLSQDSRGLLVRAQMDGSRSDVRNLASAVERGDLDEMSIGFVTMGQEWSPDWETRAMTDLELHRGDVSAVALAANPSTAGATMTALPAETLSQRAAAASHGPYDGTHKHAHPAFGSQGDDASHEHEHTHHNDASHDHHSGQSSQQRPGSLYMINPDEGVPHHASGLKIQRAQGEIQDFSTAPDFNVPAAPNAYDAGAHSWKPSVSCPNNQCPVYAAGDGRAQNEMDSKNCDQCGGPLYNADGLIVADDSGVVEEVGGALADADLLSRRLRLLELA